MNRDRLLVRVIVENNDLQEPASSIRTDDEISAFAGDHPQRIADGMLDVFVADAVRSRAVRDLHQDKVALSRRLVKAPCQTATHKQGALLRHTRTAASSPPSGSAYGTSRIGQFEAFHELVSLLQPPPAGSQLLRTGISLSAEDSRRVAAKLWNLEGLAARYRGVIAETRDRTDRAEAHRRDSVAAFSDFAAATIPILEVIADDPDLPAELLLADWPGDQLAATCMRGVSRLRTDDPGLPRRGDRRGHPSVSWKIDDAAKSVEHPPTATVRPDASSGRRPAPDQ